jgi:hypothetical protein
MFNRKITEIGTPINHRATDFIAFSFVIPPNSLLAPE